MSFGSWLKRATRVRLDKKSFGNLLKNVAPAAAFTPLGVVGAGLLATGGGLARGEKPGKALMSGVENAVLGGGLASIGEKVGVGSGAHVGMGFGKGAAAHAASLPGDIPGVSTVGGEALPATAGNAIELGGGGNPLLNAGKGALHFAESHPNAAAGALQGVGAIVGSGAENRVNNARADLMEQQAGETAYDFERRKARDAALAPVWSALGSQIGSGYKPSANPYSPVG